MPAGVTGLVLPDAVPIGIEIASPSEGPVLTSSPVTVTGSASGTAPFSVQVNSVAASVSDGSFSAEVPLSEGANTLTAEVSDTDARTASDAVDVQLEAVDLSVPAGGTATGSRTIAADAALLDQLANISIAVSGLPSGLSYAPTGFTRVSATELVADFEV